VPKSRLSIGNIRKYTASPSRWRRLSRLRGPTESGPTASDEVLVNQQEILQNQRTILANQQQILANQNRIMAK
jgi:hypothetical protein